jgi:hypothetical protein
MEPSTYTWTIAIIESPCTLARPIDWRAGGELLGDDVIRIDPSHSEI